MRHERSQTKIIATMGPSCNKKEVLKQMFLEGIDVCRLNFSHGNHDDHLQVIKIIRELNDELNCSVAILGDLQGPKLRIGDVEKNNIEIKEGEELTFVNKPCVGTKHGLYMSYTGFAKDVEKGDIILIDDGRLRLETIYSNKKDMVKAKVINGGNLSSKKGVNLPNTKISQPSLTKKDINDARFALENDVDWIALSFVRSASDILDLKDIIKKSKKHAAVIAKIEKPEALKEINNIIDLSDGIMVARGDLGVEIPFDEVPLVQKQLVRTCIKKAKPVIIATQMMESMIHNFRPTRAEANDVGNAVLDGADAVMLSGETSVGKYPVEAIRSMQQIIDKTEGKGFEIHHDNIPKDITPTFLPDSLCFNATKLSENTNAKAIILFTYSGHTAFRVSSHRPHARIYAFTNNKRIISRLSLLWGVRAFNYNEDMNIVESIEFSTEFLKKQKLLTNGDIVVHLGSSPVKKRGQTNTLKLSYV